MLARGGAFPSMKSYADYGLPGGQGTAAAPPDPRFDLRRHADGLNRAYGGPGAAPFALALAADATGDDQAHDAYPKLKSRLVAALPADGWSPEGGWLRLLVAGVGRGRGRPQGPWRGAGRHCFVRPRPPGRAGIPVTIL